MILEIHDELVRRTVCIEGAHGEVVLSDTLEPADGAEPGVFTTLGFPPEIAIALGQALAEQGQEMLVRLDRRQGRLRLAAA